MKPSRFDYLVPRTLEEAVDMLARHEGEAKVLAGGQSLVPAMNFRLATPSALVDLNRIDGLRRVHVDGGELVIESLVRHIDLATPAIDDATTNLIAAMSHLVGHLPIRVRGTFAGSLAHADPAAEWCMLALALDATIVAHSPRGVRPIPASEFFEGLFTTALTEDEVISEVRVPLLGRAGTGFHEKSQTAGDFATIAAVATVQLEGNTITAARLGIAGAEGKPVRAGRAEQLLSGAQPTSDAIAAAARAAAEGIDPISDPQCSGDYRRRLVEVLGRRALDDAIASAA